MTLFKLFLVIFDPTAEGLFLAGTVFLTAVRFAGAFFLTAAFFFVAAVRLGAAFLAIK